MSPKSGRALALAGAALASAVAGTVQADERLEEAITVGPSRCLDRAVVARHVAMWLKQRQVDGRIAIEVSDLPEGVRFVVRREGAVVGQRTLHVDKVPCQEIHAALGLGIASAIDATVLDDLGVAAPAPPPPVPIPVPVAPPAPTPNPPPVATAPLAWTPPLAVPLAPSPPPPAPPRGGPVLTTTLHGMVLVSVLPKVTLGLAPAAELSIVRGFDLRGSALLTDTVSIAVGSGTADASLLAGRLDACATRIFDDDVARLRGCVGIVAGAVAAQGAGFPDARAATSGWVAPSIRTDARWSLTKMFGLVVGLDGFFPGLKPELQVVAPDGTVIAAETFPLAGVGVSMGPSLTF